MGERRFDLSADSLPSVREGLEFLRVRFYEISAKYKEQSPERKNRKVETSDDVQIPVQVGIKNEDSEVGVRISVEYSGK